MTKKTIIVHFQRTDGTFNNRDYHFLTFLDAKKDDLVVVDTVHGPRIAKVVRNLDKSEENLAQKYVVSIIDMDIHGAKLEALELEERRLADIAAKQEDSDRHNSEIQYYEKIIETSSDLLAVSIAKQVLKDLQEV